MEMLEWEAKQAMARIWEVGVAILRDRRWSVFGLSGVVFF
jgi:hypothetical protein